MQRIRPFTVLLIIAVTGTIVACTPALLQTHRCDQTTSPRNLRRPHRAIPRRGIPLSREWRNGTCWWPWAHGWALP